MTIIVSKTFVPVGNIFLLPWLCRVSKWRKVSTESLMKKYIFKVESIDSTIDSFVWFPSAVLIETQ